MNLNSIKYMLFAILIVLILILLKLSNAHETTKYIVEKPEPKKETKVSNYLTDGEHIKHDSNFEVNNLIVSIKKGTKLKDIPTEIMKQKTGLIIMNSIDKHFENKELEMDLNKVNIADLITYLSVKYDAQCDLDAYYNSGEQVYTFNIHKAEDDN